MRDAYGMTTPEDAFIVLGDLFDHHAPTPALIRATQDAFDQGGCGRAFAIPGNHDQSTDTPGDNACSPLWIADCVDRTRVIVDGDTAALLVPFGAPVADTLEAAALKAAQVEAWSAKPIRVVLGHFGISLDSDPPYLQGAGDAISAEDLRTFCEAHDVDGVAAGNWHLRRDFSVKDGPAIVQVGALAPTGWDNPGWNGYGTVTVWDEEALAWHATTLPGPRFVRHVPSPDELDKHRDCAIYARVDATPDDVVPTRERLAGLDLAGYEVRVVDPAGEKAAQEAAAAVRTVELLGEALGRYVAAMPVPEGVTRAELLQAATSYLPRVS